MPIPAHGMMSVWDAEIDAVDKEEPSVAPQAVSSAETALARAGRADENTILRSTARSILKVRPPKDLRRPALEDRIAPRDIMNGSLGALGALYRGRHL